MVTRGRLRFEAPSPDTPSFWEILVIGCPSRYDMYSTNRVFPQPVGPLNRTGIFERYAASNSSTSSPMGT